MNKIMRYRWFFFDLIFLIANQDVHALTQKLSSILPTTSFKYKLETSAMHF